MSANENLSDINTLENLTTTIQDTNAFFLDKVQRQVNTALTLRNWIIGYYIAEYEQSGKDRANYGKQLFKAIAESLLKKGLKSIRKRHLYLCTDLYKSYPQILRILSAELDSDEFHADINLLLTNLTFSIL